MFLTIENTEKNIFSLITPYSKFLFFLYRIQKKYFLTNYSIFLFFSIQYIECSRVPGRVAEYIVMYAIYVCCWSHDLITAFSSSKQMRRKWVKNFARTTNFRCRTHVLLVRHSKRRILAIQGHRHHVCEPVAFLYFDSFSRSAKLPVSITTQKIISFS